MRLDALEVHTPMALALLRLDLMERGEADPIEAAREEAEFTRQVEGEDAWELAVGEGYTGERMRLDYRLLREEVRRG
ncbi:hypothetical protein [Calidithermus chliarophilus]|uniref:hypothetical protein n=1 Tax=Calidithermus chliarophilus TaxID=52023 RepID=UPI0003F4AF71|nr:hypothetical protein [Calidithermus chliarophilus]